jgi:hypothetical protein
MKTKPEMIEIIKAENPTLRLGDDESGYTELSADEYEAKIAEWADARLAKEAKVAEAEAKAQAKAELLERLGITADEAKLLLA